MLCYISRWRFPLNNTVLENLTSTLHNISLPTMKEVPFEGRFGMLVDVEYSNRKNNRLKRLIRQAEFEQPDASIAAIDYQSGGN